MRTQTVYDPETVSLLAEVLDRAAAAIPREQRTNECKTRLASNILGAAAGSTDKGPIAYRTLGLEVPPSLLARAFRERGYSCLRLFRLRSS
jgi:hypothetical protein